LCCWPLLTLDNQQQQQQQQQQQAVEQQQEEQEEHQQKQEEQQQQQHLTGLCCSHTRTYSAATGHDTQHGWHVH
jgi:hypothetical protein